ncbi:MAG: hypothetical protein ACRDQZ_26305 [Mycobacteriales bacterium]
MAFVTLPDGHGVNTNDIGAVKIEEFVPGKWYVHVEIRQHPRVTIPAGAEQSASAIARSINEGIHLASSGQA